MMLKHSVGERLIPLLVLMALLTACDTQSERDQAAATKLAAQAQLVQSESDAATARALVAAQDSHVADLQLIVWVSVVLAAGSMALSVALVFVMHRIARQQPATVVYQIMPPPERYEWPEARARRRAMAQIEAERKV